MELKDLPLEKLELYTCPYCENTDIFDVSATKKMCNGCLKTFDVINDSPKKFLAFDMDGTLTPSRQAISSEMLNKLYELNKTHGIIIVTGGSMELVKKQILNHVTKPMKLYIATTSGTQLWFYNNKTLSMLFTFTIPWYNKAGIFVALDNMISEFKMTPQTHISDMVDDRVSQITFSETGRNAESKVKDMYDVDRSKRTKYVNWINENYKQIQEFFDIVIGGTTAIDFVPKEYNKGKAIEVVMAKVNLELKDVIYFGDKLMPGGNDHVVIDYCECIEVTDDKDTLKKLGELK